MALNAGTRLGTYEIVGLLGAGGMGEVYRARDSKLKRDVAIKVLPNEFSSDAGRISRFQREAEVLASLKPSSHRGDSRSRGVGRVAVSGYGTGGRRDAGRPNRTGSCPD